jgi:hypothetical protein
MTFDMFCDALMHIAARRCAIQTMPRSDARDMACDAPPHSQTVQTSQSAACLSIAPVVWCSSSIHFERKKCARLIECSFPGAASTADAYVLLMQSIVSHYDEAALQQHTSTGQRGGPGRAKAPTRAPTVRDVLSNRLYENAQFGELLIL